MASFLNFEKTAAISTITVLNQEVFSYSSHFSDQNQTRRNLRERLGYRLRVQLVEVGREERMLDRVA